MVSRILCTVFNHVAPTVASSSYAIGSTVATKIAPAVASSSYAIGSATTIKIGEAIQALIAQAEAQSPAVEMTVGQKELLELQGWLNRIEAEFALKSKECEIKGGRIVFSDRGAPK